MPPPKDSNSVLCSHCLLYLFGLSMLILATLRYFLTWNVEMFRNLLWYFRHFLIGSPFCMEWVRICFQNIGVFFIRSLSWKILYLWSCDIQKATYLLNSFYALVWLFFSLFYFSSVNHNAVLMMATGCVLLFLNSFLGMWVSVLLFLVCAISKRI